MKSAVLVTTFLLASFGALAAEIPKLDFERTCRDTPPVGMNKQDTFNACMTGEKSARDSLAPAWSRARPQARGDCLRMTQLGGQSSYVELLTCLEMDEQGREAAKANASGVVAPARPARSEPKPKP